MAEERVACVRMKVAAAAAAGLLVVAVLVAAVGNGGGGRDIELESNKVGSIWGSPQPAAQTQAGTGATHFQNVDLSLLSAGEAAVLAQQAATLALASPRLAVSQWSPQPGVSKRMITTFPGSNPKGTRVQIQIRHPKVQDSLLDDPAESAAALHDVDVIEEQRERLKRIDRGHSKILLHKLTLLDDKLRDVVAMRSVENKEALAGVYSQDNTLTHAQHLMLGARDLLAATRLARIEKWPGEPLSESARKDRERHQQAWHQSHSLPSQRAIAAAESARARLHAKWLRSHPWGEKIGGVDKGWGAHFLNSAHSETLAALSAPPQARAPSEPQPPAAEYAVGAQGAAVALPLSQAPGVSAASPLQAFVEGQAVSAQIARAQGGGGEGVTLGGDAEAGAVRNEVEEDGGGEGGVRAVVEADGGGNGMPGMPSLPPLPRMQPPEPMQPAAQMQPPVVEAFEAPEDVAKERKKKKNEFHPCTNQGCDMAHMLNMPPLGKASDTSSIRPQTTSSLRPHLSMLNMPPLGTQRYLQFTCFTSTKKFDF